MLALIAGEGALPGLLIEALDADGTAFRLCEMDGHPCEARGDRPIIRFRIEKLGSFIAELKSYGVEEVCFAGHMARPKLDPSAIDAATMPLVPRMMAALQVGDDAALRLVLGFFEEAGLEVIGAHQLRSDLIPDAGVLGMVQPDDQAKADADRGIEIIGAMAAADIGQACIVSKGQALAVEAIGGTDWMMASLLSKRTDPRSEVLAAFTGDAPMARAPKLPEGGILIKAAKPGQEMRIDMPAVGPDTVRRAAQVGLTGIVIEQGNVMVLHAPKVIQLADHFGLFVWVKQ